MTPKEKLKQNLFLLRLYYKKVIEIFEAINSGYVLIQDMILNYYYVHLTEFIDTILAKKELKNLRGEAPELYESIIGDMEDIDISWEFLRKYMWEFLGKIERQCILLRVPNFKLSSKLQNFINEVDEAILEHRKLERERSVDFEKKLKEYSKKMKKELNKDGFDFGNKNYKKKQNKEPVTSKVEIIGLQDGLRAIAQTKKEDKNKFPYKLPLGTKWENFTIKFENDENVFIQVKQFKHNADYKEMGMVGRGKNPNPSEAWTFMRVLAQVNGELTIKDTQARDKYKKQKELLAKALQSYFSLDYDPFYPYHSSIEKSGNSYKIKITLIPPDKKERSDANKNDNDDLGIKEEYKKQTPEIYDTYQ